MLISVFAALHAPFISKVASCDYSFALNEMMLIAYDATLVLCLLGTMNWETLVLGILFFSQHKLKSLVA
jgi:predicted glycosyltransferase